MLHSDIFPEHCCDGQLIELPERCTVTLTVTRCNVCWTEFSWVPDDSKWVNVVYPGMNKDFDWKS